MKNLQKYLMILGTIMLSIGISACSKQPDFDVIRERLKSLRHIICHVMMLYILSDRYGMVEEIEKRNFLLTAILIL